MPKPLQPIHFEKSLQELESIIEKLSDEKTVLDTSFSLYEDGIKIYLECLEYMKIQENKVKILKNKAEKALEKDKKALLKDFIIED